MMRLFATNLGRDRADELRREAEGDRVRRVTSLARGARERSWPARARRRTGFVLVEIGLRLISKASRRKDTLPWIPYPYEAAPAGSAERRSR